MAIPTQRPVTTTVQPKSSHISDAGLYIFLQPTFSPADYLNTALPTLAVSSSAPKTGRSVPLPELSSQLQTLLSQLNAHTSRLTDTLTQLTDEIIRSGTRLAYEVEVLQGETKGLTDTLENGLSKDIALFVHDEETSKGDGSAADEASVHENDLSSAVRDGEPEFLARLRTLTAVRSHLDSVVKTFDSAMQWPLAPSELSSLTSSFISVSAPDTEARHREEKGKKYAEVLRQEISELLSTGTEGIETAAARVEELRRLADVWKGTSEEKARSRLVETIQKLIEEKQRLSVNTVGPGEDIGRLNASASRGGMDYRYGNIDIPIAAPTAYSTTTSKSSVPEGGSGYGFLQNLRNLKSEMYFE